MVNLPYKAFSTTQDYYSLLEVIKNYVVRIETFSGHGTGFLVY
jgi:hypothetical protein